MSLLNAITTIDLFGQPIQLRIKDEKHAKTFLGGVLTVIFITLISIMGFNEIRSIMTRSQPDIDTEIQIMTDRPRLYLNKDSMPVAFLLANQSNLFIDSPEYFTLDISQGRTMTKENEIHFELTKLDYEFCKPDHFPNIDPNEFLELGLSGMHCIVNQNVSLVGFWDEEVTDYLSLKIKICQNSTEKANCAPLTEIHRKFYESTLYWNIYLQSSIFFPHNYNSPETKTVINKYKIANPSVFKEVSIFITEQVLETDNGIVFPNVTPIKSLTFDYSDTDEGLSDGIDGILVEINLFSSSNRKYIRRSYKKLQDVLSDVGGLGESLIILFYLACYIFSKYKRDCSILNEIFEFDQEEQQNLFVKRRNVTLKSIDTIHFDVVQEKKEDIQPNLEKTDQKFEFIDLMDNSQVLYERINKLRHPSIITTNKPIMNEIIKNTTNDNTKLVKISSQLLNDLQNRYKRYTLTFNFFEIISIVFCRSCSKKLHDKDKLYSACKKSIQDYLDVTYYISKMEELDKLKYILLSKQQQALFTFASKDIKTLNTKKENESQVQKLKLRSENKKKLIQQAIEQYNNYLINPMEFSKTDVKLFKLLNEEFKRQITKSFKE